MLRVQESAMRYEDIFYLLAQDGLGLATEALLLSVVTTLALREDGLLRLLVLRHLELLVLVAVRTVSPAGLRDVHLKKNGHTLHSTSLDSNP